MDIVYIVMIVVPSDISMYVCSAKVLIAVHVNTVEP